MFIIANDSHYYYRSHRIARKALGANLLEFRPRAQCSAAGIQWIKTIKGEI